MTPLGHDHPTRPAPGTCRLSSPHRLASHRRRLNVGSLSCAVVLVLVLGGLHVPGAGAAARQPVSELEDVAVRLDREGSHVEPGSAGDPRAVGLVAREISRQGDRWGLVVLAAAPPGGATVRADVLLDELGRLGSRVDTVVVLAMDGSGRDLGVASNVHTDQTLDRAIDPAADELRGDPARGFAAYYSAVTGNRLSGLPGGLGDAGSGSAPGVAAPGATALLPVLIVALIGAALLLSWRGRVAGRRAQERQIEVSRSEIGEQVSAVADAIVALDDRVALSDEPVRARFATVSQIYTEVREQLVTATDPVRLGSLEDRIDAARWELAAIEAILDGRPEPQRPADRPAACFFDPTHGAGTELVELRTTSGPRPVGVCRDCLARLEAGEQPVARTIEVGGRHVPAAAAPRAAGGSGLDLGNVLGMVVGGVVLGGLGGRRRRRSPWGGGLGGLGGFGGPVGGVGHRGVPRGFGGRGIAGRGLGGGRGRAGRGL
jgi:hypothetical protein